MRILLPLLGLLLASTFAAGQTSPSSAPLITIRTLTLENSTNQVSSADRQQIIDAVRRHTYRPETLDEIAQRVRDGFQQRGFFKAEVTQTALNVVGPVGPQESIDVTLSVKEGDLYHLKQISFTGGTVFPAGELRPQFPIADGEIFNTAKIRQGLDALRKTYASNGYVDFTPVPVTIVDDKDRTVSLQIDLQEGPRKLSVSQK